ncbi:hypothetical protein L218DRAFT_629431 [Marasmius fiardii PR-910]|nr:hypothetical protein L218DRAFT_629431 [Marasmius fiardii PR-910]
MNGSTAATVTTAATTTVSCQLTAAANSSFAPDITYTDIDPVGQIVTVQGTDNRPGFVIYQDASSGDLVAVGMSDTFATGVCTTRQTIKLEPILNLISIQIEYKNRHFRRFA